MEQLGNLAMEQLGNLAMEQLGNQDMAQLGNQDMELQDSLVMDHLDKPMELEVELTEHQDQVHIEEPLDKEELLDNLEH